MSRFIQRHSALRLRDLDVTLELLGSHYLQRRDVELLPNLARLLTDELVPLARRTGLRVRTDARAPPLTPGLARALAAIAAMRVPGAFELPRRGDSVLVLQGCFAAVVEVSMPPVPKIRRGVSPSPLPLAAATE